MIRPRKLCAVTFGVVAFLLPLSALQIHQYEKQRHLRFEEGSYPDEPAVNAGLWAAEQVLHGVGWSVADNRKSFALISPRHFVGANHFRPAAGSHIRFLSLDGRLHTYTCEKFYNIKNARGENTDLFIGELSEAIPASHKIPFYPVLDIAESGLIGRDIVVYGSGQSGPRIGQGRIARFGDSFGVSLIGSPLNDTRNYSFDYVQSAASPDDSYGEVGDSGSPSFIVADGMLTVAGIHSAILQTNLPGSGAITTTYDSFILHYRDQINEHLAHTGHRLILAPVEERDLRITSVHLTSSGILLHVHNPAQIPYDVQRTTDLGAQNWETVGPSRTGSTWTGPLLPESDTGFWRLMSYPLPVAQQE